MSISWKVIAGDLVPQMAHFRAQSLPQADMPVQIITPVPGAAQISLLQQGPAQGPDDPHCPAAAIPRRMFMQHG